MKAYEIKAGIGVIAGKTVCDPCLSALSVRYSGTTKRTLYKYKHLPSPFYLYIVTLKTVLDVAQ